MAHTTFYTKGISSTMLRKETQDEVRVGIIGCGRVAKRFPSEAAVVSGVKVCAAYDVDKAAAIKMARENKDIETYSDIGEMLEATDAVYIATPHLTHYGYIKKAVEAGKHVLCETPMVLSGTQAKELYELAEKRECVLMEANKTVHCTAFNNLIVKKINGVIGEKVTNVEILLSINCEDGTICLKVL